MRGDLIEAMQLQVTGSAALNIGPGNVVASVTGLELNMLTMDVVTGNAGIGTAGTLAGAHVLSVSVDDASLFVGTGHDGLDAVTHEVAPLNGNEIGVNVSGASLSLVSVADAAGTESYTGLSAGVDDAQLLGINAVELWATGTAKLNQGDATTLERIDWATATGVDTDPTDRVISASWCWRNEQ